MITFTLIVTLLYSLNLQLNTSFYTWIVRFVVKILFFLKKTQKTNPFRFLCRTKYLTDKLNAVVKMMLVTDLLMQYTVVT